MKNKCFELQDTCDELKLDALALTEHWLKDGEEVEIKIDGYKLASSYNRGKKKRGGSCIYLKNNLDFIECPLYKDKSIEGIIECVGVQIPKLNIHLVSVYRPPYESNKEVFFEIMEELLACNKNKYSRKLMVAGDFNINISQAEDKTVLKLLGLFSKYNCKPAIETCTRVQGETRTLIDNVFINEDEFYSKVMDLCISDHYAQLVQINTEAPSSNNNEYIKFQKRNYSPENLDIIKNELDQVKWDFLTGEKDVDTIYNSFYDKLISTVNKYCPKKILKKRIGAKSKTKLSTPLKNRIKKRKQLYKDLKNGNLNKEDYTKFKNKLKRDINKYIKQKNEHTIKISKNKSKTTWNVVEKILGKNKITKRTEPVKDIEVKDDESGTVINDLHTKSNHINKKLVNICTNTNLSGAINLSNINENKNTIKLDPVSPKEILDSIKSLNNTKAVGSDEISVELIKKCKIQLIEPLKIIIDQIFETGKYPQNLKFTKIKLIHKKGCKKETGNYRPIALTSNLSKVIEKVILQRMFSFLEEHNILNCYQNGFVHKRSTSRAIYQGITSILEGLNDKKHTIGLFVDLSKAFDRVHHDILCQKIIKLGLRDKFHSIIKSYLENRYQCITYSQNEPKLTKPSVHTPHKIYDVIERYSDWTKVEKGVPQGSILGPILFVLYINDLPKMLNALSVLFADDTSIILKSKETLEIKHSLITVLDQLMHWFKSNNFVPNLEKTYIVKFTTNYTLVNESDPIDIIYNNKKIPQTSIVKFLGIHVDDKLNWKKHIQYLNAKILKFNFALNVISKKVGISAALISYYAFVQSNLTYGIIFWGNSVEADRIFIAQKSCIRSIFHLDYRTSCKDTLIKNNILSFPCLFIFECSKFVKKHYDEFFKDKETQHRYETRAIKHKILKKPKTQLSQIQNNVEWQLINIYNKIPKEIKNLQYQQFANELASYLKIKCFYSIKEFIES